VSEPEYSRARIGEILAARRGDPLSREGAEEEIDDIERLIYSMFTQKEFERINSCIDRDGRYASREEAAERLYGEYTGCDGSNPLKEAGNRVVEENFPALLASRRGRPLAHVFVYYVIEQAWGPSRAVTEANLDAVLGVLGDGGASLLEGREAELAALWADMLRSDLLGHLTGREPFPVMPPPAAERH
jgi:hypothetical protein